MVPDQVHQGQVQAVRAHRGQAQAGPGQVHQVLGRAAPGQVQAIPGRAHRAQAVLVLVLVQVQAVLGQVQAVPGQVRQGLDRQDRDRTFLLTPLASAAFRH